MEQEIWKRVVINNKETLYEISNKGRCRRPDKLHWKTGGILTPKYNKSNGYYSYCIVTENGKHNYCYIHRMVAESFLKTEDFSLQVNHIDGNKQNNNIENLEWVTRKQNMKHAFENNLVGTVSPVEQYTLDGKFVREYNSISEAVRENMSFSVSTISACAMGKYSNAHGYQWKYKNSDKIIETDKTKFMVRNQEVLQYDLQGNYIKTFPNLASCYIELGKIDNGVISQVCKGKRKSYLGFQWRYKSSNLSVEMLKPKEKRVGMLDREGNLLKEFDSIKEASEHLGQKDNGAISRVCKGKKTSHLGYVWTYLD